MLNQLTVDRFVATPSRQPHRLATWIAAAVAAARSRRTQSQVVRELQQRDPHMLRDIGVNAAALFANPPRIDRIEQALDQQQEQ